MTGSEDDSRSAAVGRKRNLSGKFNHSVSSADGETGKRQRQVSTIPGHESHAGGSGSRRSSEESDDISMSGSGSSAQVRPPSREISIPVSFSLKNLSRRGSSISQTQSHDDREENAGTAAPESRNDSEEASPDHGAELSQHLSTDKENSMATPGLRLKDVSHSDQVQQCRYFNIENPEDLVRCLSCGRQGHAVETCPARTCEHCGAYDTHISRHCPTFRKCTRCRVRGHDAVNCKNRSVPAGGPDDPCDICACFGHSEGECHWLASRLIRDEFPGDRFPGTGGQRDTQTFTSSESQVSKYAVEVSSSDEPGTTTDDFYERHTTNEWRTAFFDDSRD